MQEPGRAVAFVHGSPSFGRKMRAISDFFVPGAVLALQANAEISAKVGERVGPNLVITEKHDVALRRWLRNSRKYLWQGKKIVGGELLLDGTQM